MFTKFTVLLASAAALVSAAPAPNAAPNYGATMGIGLRKLECDGCFHQELIYFTPDTTTVDAADWFLSGAVCISYEYFTLYNFWQRPDLVCGSTFGTDGNSFQCADDGSAITGIWDAEGNKIMECKPTTQTYPCTPSKLGVANYTLAMLYSCQ